MCRKLSLLFLFLMSVLTLSSQGKLNTPQLHSHNDYLNSVPFYEAYINGAASIEIDVFIHKNQLYVAHDFDKIQEGFTLEKLYIEPLLSLIEKGKFPRNTYTQPLQYLFDVKSRDSVGCLEKLIEICEQYPSLFTGNFDTDLVRFVVSGNRPKPATFKEYPSYILFDGRPYETYSNEQLEKIGLISDNFRNYSVWNGKGRMIDKDLEAVNAVISKVHGMNKPIRFWATPDSKSSWEAFYNLGVDFVNTDHTKAASAYLENAKISRYSSKNNHKVEVLNRTEFGEVKNVILMIGDGMGVSQLSSGLLANNGELYMGQFASYGFSMTQAADDFTTDSAAGGTAMATGVKTKNRYIGLDPDGNELETLVDLSHNKGLKTGVVTTDDITGATPSSFYAHQLDRDLSKGIVNDFVQSNVDLFIGNGERKMNTLFDTGVEAIRKNGYIPIVNSFESWPKTNKDKPVVFISNTSAIGDHGNPVVLKQMASTALKYLSTKNEKGFFLMIENGNIDSGGHNNSTEQVVEEVLAFDKAVGEVLKFAQRDGNTLVIVTADHETGGMSLPQGNKVEGTVQGMFHSHDHTGAVVPVMAYGPGSKEFIGMYQNIEIFQKIVTLLEITTGKKE